MSFPDVTREVVHTDILVTVRATRLLAQMDTLHKKKYNGYKIQIEIKSRERPNYIT